MRLDHWQKTREYRKDYAARLEYFLLKEDNPRMKFYTAREYAIHNEHQKAIDMYERYLKVAYYRPEILEAYLQMARCAWQIQRGDDSRRWCLKAISINPDCKQALIDMSAYTGEGQSVYWKRMSEGATNNDVMFNSV